MLINSLRFYNARGQTYFNDYVGKCVLYVIINENCLAYDPAVESDNQKTLEVKNLMARTLEMCRWTKEKTAAQI